MTLRRSPLDGAHRALGARMVEFGGWAMPLAYPSGTVAEHLACRRRAAAFDVSHLGTVRVEGAGALERLQAMLSNDLGRIGPGRAQYTHLLDPADGSVVDDLIVWWVEGDRFDVMPNASNTASVLSALGGRDVTTQRAVVAVQGPDARRQLATLAPAAASVARFAVVPFAWQGRPALAAGTGYTGEDGVECALARDGAESFWSALLAAGVAPAGLGARDTLRLEAGLPLHGHELGRGITPLQAGLGWVVSWDKPELRGRAALEAERSQGPARRLWGLVMDSRQPPRPHQEVLVGERSVGEVTSGNYSPILERGIALALLSSGGLGAGDRVVVDVRGRRAGATVVRPPFVGPRAALPAGLGPAS